ncbi:kinase-like domain-containing protein [Tanacetum coccineum]|uniref:Kinase-like domain-containing protein n=1 Tax=Tanacetum coccineum TaxID=301880 RepID=A0ABQ5FQY5_9ASTR
MAEVKDLKMLKILDLYYNNLSGNISIFGECIGLSTLNLRGNIFHGKIPLSLSSLRGLEVFDISQNNLSGRIPEFLDKWVSLEFLDLSFNDFEGEVPIVGVFANISAFSVLGNNKLCGGLVTLELPKCKEKGSKKKRFPFFIFVIVIAPTLLIVLCCVHLLWKKKHNTQPSESSGNERFLKVSYNQLLKATDGFSTANLIGEGGCSVYKGILHSDDDRLVAVKVLHLVNRGAHKSNDFKALVYDFMPNGSVHDWLHSIANTMKLNLVQRINILKDVATALDYLHNRCQTTIVHGDLKPSNILLDSDMVAHVGDFGLVRLLGTDLNQNNSTGVKGTIEYGIGSEMTSSGDVYSFGISLLELMTGKKPTDDKFNEGLSIHKFASMALPDHVAEVIDDDAIVLQSTEANAKKVEECLVATIKIRVSCSVDSPPQRMKIEIVVIELQRILDSTITHDPYKALATWNHSFHFCDWSGISIGKRHKRVTALRLESQGLEGSLSPHVGNLSFLRKLSLPNNSFQGTIPHEVGRLSRLHILYLSQNKFSGVIPTNLSRCSNLEDLWLNRNELTGSIPKEISLLSKLARLKIEYNKLTGGIPSFLGNITSMEVFSSAENPLGGSIPDTLGLWKSLTEHCVKSGKGIGYLNFSFMLSNN